MKINGQLLALSLALAWSAPAQALDSYVGTYANQYGKIIIRHINPGNYALIVQGNRNKCVFRVAVSPTLPDEAGSGLCANAREKKYGSFCVNLLDGVLTLDQEKIPWESLEKNCEGLKEAGNFIKNR